MRVSHPESQITPKVCAIYCRVSTSDQRDRGFSLPTQREACLALAVDLGYTVPEAYAFTEDYSGVSLRRPQLSHLRDLVQQRAIQAVVIYDPDRLSRKLAHQLLLEDEFAHAGVVLHIVTMPDRSATPEGILLSQIRGVISEFERTRILERTRRGREGRARAGHALPGGRTYGYRRILDKHGAHYEVDPEESLIVQRIFPCTYIYGPARPVKGLSNGPTHFGTDAVIYPALW